MIYEDQQSSAADTADDYDGDDDDGGDGDAGDGDAGDGNNSVENSGQIISVVDSVETLIGEMHSVEVMEGGSVDGNRKSKVMTIDELIASGGQIITAEEYCGQN